MREAKNEGENFPGGWKSIHEGHEAGKIFSSSKDFKVNEVEYRELKEN
jgi:hypothetical protein